MEQWEFDAYGYVDAFLTRAKMALEKAHFDLPLEKRPVGVIVAFPDTTPAFYENDYSDDKSTAGEIDQKDIAEFVESVSRNSIDGGNAIIIACHEEHGGVVTRTVNMMRAFLEEKGLPADLVQVVIRTKESYLRMFKRRTSLAVFGDKTVSFPESDQKTENALAFLDWDTDLNAVIPAIIEARARDNGLDISAEQTVFVPRQNLLQFRAIAEENNAYFVWNLIEESLIRQYLFSDATQLLSTRPDGVASPADPRSVGKINPDSIGKSVPEITKALLLKARPDDRVLFVPGNIQAGVDLIFREKLSPVLAVYAYNELSDALIAARDIMKTSGRNHSVSIWPGEKMDGADSEGQKFVSAVKTLPAVRFSVGEIASKAPVPEKPCFDRLYWEAQK